MINSVYVSEYIKNINPNIKAVFALSVILLCIIFKEPLGCIFAVSVMWVLIIKNCRLSRDLICHIVLWPVLFIALSTFMLSFDITDYSGEIFSVKIIKGYFLTVNSMGIEKAIRLFFTSAASLSSMYFLSFTTPVNDIVYVLKTIKCPKEITELFMLIYRFIFIVLNMAHSITTAQNCRMAQRPFKTRINAMALMLSGVFVLSSNKSLFMYNAMLSRCYSGDINFLNEKYDNNRKHVLFAVVVVLVIVLISTLERVF